MEPAFSGSLTHRGACLQLHPAQLSGSGDVVFDIGSLVYLPSACETLTYWILDQHPSRNCEELFRPNHNRNVNSLASQTSDQECGEFPYFKALQFFGMKSDNFSEGGDGKGGSLREGAGQPGNAPTLYRISTKASASREAGGARQCVTDMELW